MPDPEAPRRLFRNAKRELLVTFLVFLAALAWSVGYCWLFGYRSEVELKNVDFQSVLGFPSWVMFGIVLPWVACTGFTVWYGLWGMQDDDLGAEAREEEDGHGH
jgi:hypothetical protein